MKTFLKIAGITAGAIFGAAVVTQAVIMTLAVRELNELKIDLGENMNYDS